MNTEPWSGAYTKQQPVTRYLYGEFSRIVDGLSFGGTNDRWSLQGQWRGPGFGMWIAVGAGIGPERAAHGDGVAL